MNKNALPFSLSLSDSRIFGHKHYFNQLETQLVELNLHFYEEVNNKLLTLRFLGFKERSKRNLSVLKFRFTEPEPLLQQRLRLRLNRDFVYC